VPAADASAVEADAALVARQIGRIPREPWRIVVRCQWGRPNVIASPSRLADGTPFPTLYWLTCPWLIESAGALESEGLLAEWTDRAASDATLAAGLGATHAALAERRAEESGGVDACAGVGVAGQAGTSRVKCLHAHVALTLAGIEDPVGAETIALLGIACENDACAPLAETG
jgi:uncharacterized protein